MYIGPTFKPIVDWVVGKDNPELSTTDALLDVVVLRGYSYADPVLAASWDHDGWMTAFRQFFAECYPNPVDIVGKWYSVS